MRVGLTLLTVTLGVALAIISYFVLAAPLGTPSNEGASNPAVSFAATLFVVGVALVFIAPVVYELLPDRTGR